MTSPLFGLDDRLAQAFVVAFHKLGNERKRLSADTDCTATVKPIFLISDALYIRLLFLQLLPLFPICFLLD